MVRVPEETQPQALSLVEELRLAALQARVAATAVDQEQLAKDVAACVSWCLRAAQEHNHETVYTSVSSGWLGWDTTSFGFSDWEPGGLSRSDVATVKHSIPCSGRAELVRLFRVYCEPLRAAAAKAQVAALADAMRKRGLVVKVRYDVVLFISWKKRWWEYLLGRLV
jgi:hypothetical protein